MSYQLRSSFSAIALLLAALACNLTPTATPGATPETRIATDEADPTVTTEDGILATADRDGVEMLDAGGVREALPSPQQANLEVGQGVDVDEAGRAILQFADLLTVEVMRDGELTVDQLSLEEQSSLVSVLLLGGTLINDFNPEAEIDKRLTVQTEFATITATGTRFIVARELGTPLEWVVAFDAQPGDLQVTAAGVTKEVQTGVARWVAPIGEPSAGIDALMGEVDDWTDEVRQGAPVEEIGERVWAPADLQAGTFLLGGVPELDQPTALSDIDLTVDAGGMTGNPSYGFGDCTGSGIDALILNQGITELDFRNVLARVRAVDVSIYNFSSAGGVLVGLDPARNEVASARVTAGHDEVQTLSLRSEGPMHYAELRLEDGCILGVSLTPPQPDGSPSQPRPAPGDTAYITGIELGFDDVNPSYIVDFVTTGFAPRLPGQHVHFFFNTVTPEQAGVPGQGPWIVYGGESPFTEYSLIDRPENATQMCILVANPDHTVQLETGNCHDLPN